MDGEGETDVVSNLIHASILYHDQLGNLSATS
jgi:hypothetical protein